MLWARRALETFRRTSLLRVRTPPEFLLKDLPIAEENLPYYNPKHYYPVRVGEVLNDTFLVTNKLDYGLISTIWLARDLRRWSWENNRYVVLKMFSNNEDFKHIFEHETMYHKHIMDVAPNHPGLFSIRKAYDSFTAQGPAGPHVCLVCEPMVESFSTYQQRFDDKKASIPAIKLTVWLMLSALDYLHRKCRLIYTDITLSNILMSANDLIVLDQAAREEYTDRPAPRKVLNDRIIYSPRSTLSEHTSYIGFPKLADFRDVMPGAAGIPLNYTIQFPPYRSPEVVLGAEWSYSTDVWNLGVLIWDMLEGRHLFEGLDPYRLEYGKPVHLAQMIALLGSPPAELLARGAKSSDYFNPNDSFKYPELIPCGRSLENSVTQFEDEADKELFFGFVRKMLRWLPENRATCRELLEHPWLGIKP
ncbi:hypothetical protein FRC12_007195 [Ceratobasidium sp. 428]|nr:hypothetical protein FRC12_007195 [Ceratobasidium sp. 428]